MPDKQMEPLGFMGRGPSGFRGEVTGLESRVYGQGSSACAHSAQLPPMARMEEFRAGIRYCAEYQRQTGVFYNDLY